MSGIIDVARTAGNLRISRFVIVGVTCAIFQLTLNLILIELGFPALLAFVGSFVISAQLNFLLSDRFTWGSRRAASPVRRGLLRRWLGYNGTTLVSLAISSATFALVSQVLGNSISVVFGIAAGAGVTFFAGDRLVFSGPPGRHSLAVQGSNGGSPRPSTELGRRIRSAALDSIPHDRLLAMLGSGIAVFLPSYNEADNLPLVVRNTVTALRETGAPYQVIIVNDGSSDNTAAVADELVREYEQDVIVVSHVRNLGYGNALRTGFSVALRGGWDWIGFTDSDNQFSAQQMKDLIAAAYYEPVDLVAGYRVKRADGLQRRLIGRMWHVLTRLVVGIRERDVDCGYKLVHRNVLEKIDLQGSYAAVSPELLAKSRRAGFHSTEVGVDHFPRTMGEQTGANLAVIVHSLISLLHLRLSISHARLHNGTSVGSRSFTGARGIAAIATALSIGSFCYFYLKGETLAYDDSISHLLISRRLIEGVTPGAAQLGSVWLPLPHLLLQPIIWLDSLYYSGIAGSLLSMVAFVTTTVLLFRTATVMTGSLIGGWIAGLVFALNPNMLFLQTTPMTETLLFACMAAAVYQLVLWSKNERWQNLAGAAAATFLASLTRYEGWVLLGAFGLAVLGIATRRSYGRDRLFGSAIFFSVLAAAGVAAWLLWNRVIFGSFTDFATGQFAKSSIWVGQSDVAVGNVLLSVETYALAVTGTVGLPIVLLGVGGVIAYLLIGRLRPTFVAPLTLLVFVPFFVFALYSGQRPLHVAQISGDQYNTRFGLVMLLPMALFTAYLTVTLGHWLTDIVRQRNPASTGASVRATRATVGLLMGAVALLVFAGTAMAGGILTLQEPLNWGANRTVLDGAADALRDDYDGGRVLMQGWGNEYVEFASHVPASETIYEGSYQLWQPALADPAGANIRWIYLSRASTDLVWQSLGTSAALTDYTIRFDDGTRVIYQRQT